MKITQKNIKFADKNKFQPSDLVDPTAQLALVFASVSFFTDEKFMKSLLNEFPTVKWMGCSTAGEVSSSGVRDETAVITSVRFDDPSAKFKLIECKLDNPENSKKAGQTLADGLKNSDLKYIFILGPGVNVNGSELVKGMSSAVSDSVRISGGLAGDAGKFEKTYTLTNEGVFSDRLVAIGFYGDGIKAMHGCQGGWDAFGKTRKVTKVKGNILYELDNEPALTVYKNYLGEYAKDLPGSGLLFPFEIIGENQEKSGLIRTILGVNEVDGSLTFAGDIAENSNLRLMQANNDGLVQGSKNASIQAFNDNSTQQALGLIVSCVGRKIVMGINVEDEVDAVKETFGPNTVLTGFYSNGEISPDGFGHSCQLHNQTMTITRIFETNGNK